MRQPEGRRRKQVGSLNPGRQKAPERGWREPSGQACPPLPPLAPLRHSRRPHLETLSGGRAMTRGREVSTTSPRLASTRMFWIMFSSSASCRLANAGSLRGRGRTRVSARPSTARAFSAGLFRAVHCVPWALSTWVLIPLLALPALIRHHCSHFTDAQIVASRDQVAKRDPNPGNCRSHLRARFGERHRAVRGCPRDWVGLKKSQHRQEGPQNSPRQRPSRKRWHCSPGSGNPLLPPESGVLENVHSGSWREKLKLR